MENCIYQVLFIVFILFSPCCKDDKSDPCDGKICASNETCVEGVCQCPLNYTGFDCSTEIEPAAILINSIKVIRMPAKRPNGQNWDGGNTVDAHFTIYESTNEIWAKSSTVFNLNLSQEYTFTPSSPIRVEGTFKNTIDPNKNGEYLQFTLAMYDDDGNKTDEYMGGVLFELFKLGSGFPDKITADTGGAVAFELGVSYVRP